MRKILTMLTLASLMTSCGGTVDSKSNSGGKDFVADTALTEQQKTARVFTPEIMWKMGRVASTILSPDGSQFVYALSYYDMAQNAGTTALWVQPFEGGQAIQITDNKGKDHSPAWSHDGNTIYFLSDRGGSQQVWAVGTDGSSLRQLSFMDKDVTGFGISPKGDKAWLVMEVAVEKVASAQIYDSLDKSQALIYDDLMERHWDCWEDGDYSHLFVAAVTDNGITTPEDITPDEPWDIPTAPDFDNAEITWNNGGTALIYTARKLQGYQYAMSTNTDLYLYTIESKKTFNLTDGMVGYDKYPVFSPDDKWVAWLSMERAGVESDKSRLMVQQVPTGERKYLTRNFDYNAANVSWSSDCQTLFFIAPI
ncbi:MAG: peptidase S9, partial [Mucinivorans sp.]